MKRKKKPRLLHEQHGIASYEYDGFYVMLDLNAGGIGRAQLSISNAPVNGKQRDDPPTLEDAAHAGEALIPGRDVTATRSGPRSWHLTERADDRTG